MLGSEFVAQFAKQGPDAWEAAAIQLARAGSSAPWPWVPITLQANGHTAVLQVQSDDFAIGTLQDFVRLPLRPAPAQAIANLGGHLLPTPWITYQIAAQSAVRLDPAPLAMVPNAGANLAQYAAHSAKINAALSAAGLAAPALFSGGNKSVVVSNLMGPGLVVIFGWYQPAPFGVCTTGGPECGWPSNGLPMGTPGRQPVQPLSNAHGDFYVDYSHGIRLVHGACMLDGVATPTVKLYTDPALAFLVSKEGPLKTPRYPAPILPQPVPGLPAPMAATQPPGTANVPRTLSLVDRLPGYADQGTFWASHRA